MKTTPAPSLKVKSSALKRSAAAPAAVLPAWHQAACYGRRDAGDLTARNPYAYGSQCWIIYEQARIAARTAARPLTSAL